MSVYLWNKLNIPVVKKELFSLLYSSLGKNSNAVITINHDNCNKTNTTTNVLNSFNTKCFDIYVMK